MKACTKCKKEQPVENYYKRKASPDGLQPQCKTCDNARKKNRCPKQVRKFKLQQNFNLTQEQHDAILARQGGVCAICKGPQTARAFHVDHDHNCCSAKGKSCGKCIRGLLCSNCNTGVGLLNDSIARLEDAISYLKENNVSISSAVVG